MKLSFLRRRRLLAFTLVELMVVIAIIGLLAGISFPYIQGVMVRAKSVQCAGNLRSIGLAVMNATSDNGNVYPKIDQAAVPIYPAGSGAQDLVTTLAPYGITTNIIQCPVDMTQNPSSFKQYGSSYEWNPAIDDDPTTSVVIYFGTTPIPVNSSRIRLCTDFLPLHRGKMNALYGDGHVTAR